CTAQEFISNTYKYNVPELNNGATSAVLTSTNYQDIANGKKYYTRGFACINGVIEVSGSEGSSLNCDIGYEVSGDSCVKSFNCGVEKYNGRTTKLYNGICYYHTSGRYLALPMNRDTKPEGNFVIGDFLFLSDNVVYIDSRTSTYSGTPFGYTPVNKLPIYRRKGGGNPLIRCYLRKEYQKIPGQ
ncbi:MAG: hypothetical protein N4A38_02315, partial [Candidatus Gracilibacteria bacterium]|nr:hypothetical protein [Candidatus Gracilibacteria bacterium]